MRSCWAPSPSGTRPFGYGIKESFLLVKTELSSSSLCCRFASAIATASAVATASSFIGSIDKFKYRLTIKGFKHTMVQGIDFEEKYASTVRWEGMKILIAIAVRYDYDIVLFDISSFFLYGRLSAPVYMEQQAEWVTPDKPKQDYICQVNGNMYGLVMAPHIARKELVDTLTDQGKFKPTASDDCIFLANDPQTGIAFAGVHVDDIATVGNADGLKKMKETLATKFEFSETVNPSMITGVEIMRDRPNRWLKLHQCTFIKELLSKFNMLDCKGADTPVDPAMARSLMLLPLDGTDSKIIKDYQTLVGWLLKTRQDLSFPINLLCRFLKAPTKAHLDYALGRPLRYLKQTMTVGVVFCHQQGKWELSGASDADLAGDLVSSRSTTGHYLKLGEWGTIISQSRLERKVCDSTGMSETYAMKDLVHQTVWTRALLDELGIPMTEPTELETDNDGVLKQSTKTVNTTAKHYRIAQAYIREKVRELAVAVLGQDTAKNASDLFTKALHAPLFKRHFDTIMGPQQAPLSTESRLCQ